MEHLLLKPQVILRQSPLAYDLVQGLHIVSPVSLFLVWDSVVHLRNHFLSLRKTFCCPPCSCGIDVLLQADSYGSETHPVFFASVLWSHGNWLWLQLGEERKTVCYKAYNSLFLILIENFLTPAFLASRCCPLAEKMDQGYRIQPVSYCTLSICHHVKSLPENATYSQLPWTSFCTCEWLSPRLYSWGWWKLWFWYQILHKEALFVS